MTATAIVMLCVSILILWGGLISSIVMLTHAKPVDEPDAEQKFSQRDL